jgi:hypothetical protein
MCCGRRVPCLLWSDCEMCALNTYYTLGVVRFFRCCCSGILGQNVGVGASGRVRCGGALGRKKTPETRGGTPNGLNLAATTARALKEEVEVQAETGVPSMRGQGRQDANGDVGTAEGDGAVTVAVECADDMDPTAAEMKKKTKR